MTLIGLPELVTPRDAVHNVTTDAPKTAHGHLTTRSVVNVARAADATAIVTLCP
jgi:hypothetical protein